jgi:signal transduction histidine kinase/CheY-like chemotaxis protein/streptogramin lyase
MARAPDGSIWVAGHTALVHFQPATGTVATYHHDPQRPDSLPKGPQVAVHVDRSGILWLGTWHAGLIKHNPGANRFDVLSSTPGPGQPALPIDSVMGVLVDQAGRLWVGTGTLSTTGPRGGLHVLNRRSGTFRSWDFAETEVHTVVDIVESGPDTLWIGTNHGLWQCLPRQGILRRPHLDTPHARLLQDHFIRSLYVDSRGMLWINSQGQGLLELDPASGRCRLFQHDPDDPASLSQNISPVILEDSAGRLWVGTDVHGLNLFQPETATFRRFFDPQSGLVNVTDLLEGRDGRLWVGTIGGLLEFDPERGRVVDIVGRAQGLPNDMVGSILADETGHLWLSTGRGLVEYDPAERSMRIFDSMDGLPSEDVHFAHFRGPDGTLHFGGRKGLLKFHPRLVNRRNTYNPPVVLTEVRLFDQPLQPGPDTGLDRTIPLAAGLDLPWNRNQLTFVFSALDFSRPARNRYRFMLSGHDQDWRRPGSDREAVYTNLAPGSYRFRVQATNSEGIWSDSEIDFPVRIGHPWWTSPLAYVMYLATALAALVIGFRLATRRIKRAADIRIRMAELRKLREVDRIKSRFFANISHEFRTPLTLIQGPLERLEREPGSGDTQLFTMMRRNARRLGQLIDQLLDLSRLESRRFPLNWQPLDAVGQLRVLGASFQSLAQVEGLNFRVSLPSGPVPCLADPDLLEKVTANLLTNAFKYASLGAEVWLEAQVGPELPIRDGAAGMRPDRARRYRNLKLEVGNTGSYIPPEERTRIFERFYQVTGSHEKSRSGSGIGLALIKELAELLGGSIDVASDPDQGTVFTVNLPLFTTDTPIPLDRPSSLDRDSALLDLSPGADTGEERPDRETAGASPLVLVVEDDPDLRTFLFDILRKDHRVVLARDGDEGVETAFTEVPDLIVSDVMMPGRDGFELCRAVKKDERTSHIPVVLLTARTEPDSRITGLETGADSYLGKPFEPAELLAQVRNLIDQRNLLRERFARTVRAGLPGIPAGDREAIESSDARFLQRITGIAREGIGDAEFSVARFAREVGMSRSQLHRKLTALTGLSASAFLRTVRLHRAAELLRAGYGNVTEVAYASGHKSLSHFSRCFREEFGVPPSEYPPEEN